MSKYRRNATGEVFRHYKSEPLQGRSVHAQEKSEKVQTECRPVTMHPESKESPFRTYHSDRKPSKTLQEKRQDALRLMLRAHKATTYKHMTLWEAANILQALSEGSLSPFQAFEIAEGAGNHIELVKHQMKKKGLKATELKALSLKGAIEAQNENLKIIKGQLEPKIETEGQLEPKIETEEQPEPKIETEEQPEPKIETEEQPEPEIEFEPRERSREERLGEYLTLRAKWEAIVDTGRENSHIETAMQRLCEMEEKLF